jgi:hypothetical protein
MPEGFRIDENLARKLDNLLKAGSLDNKTGILEILEALSEKLNSLEGNKATSYVVEEDKEEKTSRLHHS